SGPERAKNMPGWLGDIIRQWFQNQTKAEAVKKLLAVGLPIGPVQTAGEIFNCPHVDARKFLINVSDPVLRTVKLVGSVAKLSGNPEPLTSPAALLRKANAEIIYHDLGYTEEEIGKLEVSGTS